MFGISSINKKQPPLEMNHEKINCASAAKVEEKHMVFQADLAGCRGYHVQNVVRWPWRVNAFRCPWFFYGFSLSNKAGSGKSVTRRHTLSKRWKDRNIWRTHVPIKILGKPYLSLGMGEMYNFRITLHPNIWHLFSKWFSHHCQPSQCPAHCDALHQTFAAIVQWFHLDGSLRSPSSPSDNNPQVVRKTFRLNWWESFGGMKKSWESIISLWTSLFWFYLQSTQTNTFGPKENGSCSVLASNFKHDFFLASITPSLWQ